MADIDESWLRERGLEAVDPGRLAEAAVTAAHYAEQLTAQARAGDPCIDKILAYKDADAALTDATHQSWEARLIRTVLQERLLLQQEGRPTAPGAAGERLEEEIAKTESRLRRSDTVVREKDRAASDAWAARKKAVEALKDCRRHHPYEHECGERGGPGFLRPDGKRCAAWEDLEHGVQFVTGGDD